MSRIRKLYWFDKRNALEMISFLNNSVNDTYINKLMFNPFLPLHNLLPLRFKFLPESYVLKDGKILKGLITVAPTKCKQKKIEIKKLFFEENSISDAIELVQFAVSKYKSMGAPLIKVKVDDYLPELLTALVSKCGFTQISYEKLWKITKFTEEAYDKKIYRTFRNSDAKALTNLYNDSLLPHFRPLLSKEVREFKEPIFTGLTYYTEYKYVIEDFKTKAVIGCIIIQTNDNENFILDIIQSSWVDLNLTSIISFAISRIKKRKKRFALFVKSKRFINIGEKYEEIFKENQFECVQNQVVLTNSSAKLLRNEQKEIKYTVISDFISAKPVVSRQKLNKQSF